MGNDDDEIVIKEFEIDRGKTVKSIMRKGKKTIEAWDKTGIAVRFKGKKSVENYMTYIQSQIEKIEREVELWSSKVYNKNIDGKK